MLTEKTSNFGQFLCGSVQELEILAMNQFAILRVIKVTLAESLPALHLTLMLTYRLF